MRHIALRALSGALVVGCFAPHALAQNPWPSYGGNPQHTALSIFTSDPLVKIHWSAPVDLQPQYSGDELFIHYGSPLVTAANTVVIPVKTGANDGFRLEGRQGKNGSLVWTQNSDYSLPPHNWTPPFGPTLVGAFSVAMPGAGGTVLLRDNANAGGSQVSRLAFFGLANYNANKSVYDQNVKICTPITSDGKGILYFGFRVYGDTPLHLKSGIARILPGGAGSWISASDAANDPLADWPVMNCAPALSKDVSTLYIAISSQSGGSPYLVGLDSRSLAARFKVKLTDPKTGFDANVFDDGTATPLVGPDGDVFYGVLENGFGSNHLRGWMLHFDGKLSVSKVPGAFGWDDTPSVVPSTAVPSYKGESSYLLLTKYNNYVGGGGDGVNKVAILDPSQAAIEPVSQFPTMREILTVAGPTPDEEYLSGHPNAVREWCINTAAVDAVNKCAIVNNEDGVCYRWDFRTNSLSQAVVLTSGIGEAYTPTIIGAAGTCYAINNATLFAIGR